MLLNALRRTTFFLILLGSVQSFSATERVNTTVDTETFKGFELGVKYTEVDAKTLEPFQIRLDGTSPKHPEYRFEVQYISKNLAFDITIFRTKESSVSKSLDLGAKGSSEDSTDKSQYVATPISKQYERIVDVTSIRLYHGISNAKMATFLDFQKIVESGYLHGASKDFYSTLLMNHFFDYPEDINPSKSVEIRSVDNCLTWEGPTVNRSEVLWFSIDN